MTGVQICQPDIEPLPHTQTPWYVDSIEKDVIACRRGHIARCERRGPKPYGKMQPETIGNAAFIVEAVNSHATLQARVEELTKALDTAWEEINALGGRSEQDNSYDQGVVDTVTKVLHIIERAKAISLERSGGAT